MEWLETFVEEQHFPFYEFLWLCMLGLWWSVILRLNRIEEGVNEAKEADVELLNYLMDEG
tara:strand:- start:748 stop:927 length:180 start_codon:yes stop_codon:yes gene_type:complete